MASQEWITGSNLGTSVEETSINYRIEYRRSTDTNRKTLDPILLSSNVPSSVSLVLGDNNTIIVNGLLPKVDKNTEYYFTYRLKEVEISNPSNVTNISDRYFVFTSLNEAVSWDTTETTTLQTSNNEIFEMNLKDYLVHANGNETFRKVSGELPDGVNFNENGSILGYVETDITDVTNYNFVIRAYSNGTPIENLQDKEFIISVDPEILEQKPTWTTEPELGNINKNESIGPLETRKIKLTAMNLTGNDGILRFELASNDDSNVTGDSSITGLPPGIELASDGQLVGTCTTTQVKDWYFGAYAVKYIIEEDNTIYSDFKKFVLTTNRGSAEHEINWTDPTKTYTLGTFVIGEELSLQLPLATAADGSIIKYSFSGTTYPKGIELSDDGLINGKLDLQDSGAYDFEVMAKTNFTYVTRKFRMNLKEGLSESALKLYLRINLEYKDEFTDIKDQLNPNTLYNNDIDTYNVSNFPKIDVATLKCYDREVLASMMNFGNPEIVRFGLTKSLPYSHIDSNGNLTANYEVFYKSIDENTYQWEEIDNGNYDFQSKLDQLEATGEVDKDTKLDFNKTVYNTSVKCCLFLGQVDTYSKLLACNTTELKSGYFAKVLKDETHNGEMSYYEYVNIDGTPMWAYCGNELPQEMETKVTTTPDDSYQVFNFKNVREALSQHIYVYSKEGTFFYDEGNQQIVTPTEEIDGVKKLYRDGKKYFISNEDGTDEVEVKYESHIVSDSSGHIYTNILFKPTFSSPNFMIYENGGEIYHVNQIVNPWCYDFSKNDIRIDTVPSGAEMVMPNIKTSDVNILLGGSPYVTFLDTSIEPLPMWKRKQAEIWKPYTTYKAKEIIIYDSIYYRVKQQFTTGNEFIYDTNLLETISGDVIDTELPKNFFPTLDLGYYQSGTNRRYLKDLNAAEKTGEFWYRKDFLFWELIAEPVYDTSIDTFGIPFYSTQNRLEYVNATRKKTRTFEIICNTPNAEVSIVVTEPDGTIIRTPTDIKPMGNRWKVEFLSGSHITWNVSAGSNYYEESGDYIIVSDEKHVIDLKKKCVVTVYPIPEDAKVTLIADGYEQGTFKETIFKPITVVNVDGLIDNNTYYINYENPTRVYDDGTKVYNEIYDSELVRQYYDSSLFYRCVYVNDSSVERPYYIDIPGIVTLTINPIPADATVTLTADGYTQVGNKIRVATGTRVAYKIEKEGYLPQTGSSIISENRTLNTELQSRYATLTIEPTPSNATVTLECEDYEQVDNSITVEKNKTVTYTVEKDGYVSTTSYKVVTKDETIPVTIVPYISIEIIPNPDDAVVTYNVPGYTQDDNKIIVPQGTLVPYTVSKEDYLSISDSIVALEDTVLNIDLTEFVLITIVPNPMSSTVVLSAPPYVAQGNSIKVPPDTLVSYTVSKDLYYTKTSATTATEDKIVEVTLEKYPTLTVYPIPDDSDVELTADGYTQVGNTITVPKDTVVRYRVSKDNYSTYTNTYTVTKNEDLEVRIYPHVTLTVYPNPEDATVELIAEGFEQVGNTIYVPHGTEVKYNVYRYGYLPVNDKITVNDDTDLPVSLNKQQFTYTIIPTPSESTVTLRAEGYAQVDNSITVPYETEIEWSVELEHQDVLKPQRGVLAIEENVTREIELKEAYEVNLDGYEYDIDNYHAVLTQYIGNEENIIVPHIDEE